MACVTKSIFHDNCHLVVNNILNLTLIVKLLKKDTVFDYQPGKKSNKLEFTDIYFRKRKSIVVEGLFNLY